MVLNPKVWGPHYWFVLHTIANTYPLSPNDVTKKKYYDFIQNLPLFIPIREISNSFSNLINKYPVTPYLDSRESLIRWFHFIHNKIRKQTGSVEITLKEASEEYYKHYKPKEKVDIDKKNINTLKIYGSLIATLVILAIFLHKK